MLKYVILVKYWLQNTPDTGLVVRLLLPWLFAYGAMFSKSNDFY